jgi:hypothetical protein
MVCVRALTDFSFPLSCMDKHEFSNCWNIRAFVSIGCVLVKILELIFFFFFYYYYYYYYYEKVKKFCIVVNFFYLNGNKVLLI